ncbi:28491_t:CDS:10, partial [Racocetra persica]
QKIDTWEKRTCQPGARVENVAELEKILKRLIKLLDITHGTIFNSKKYQTGRFEEIEMVVHNGHAFSRNHHFPRDRMLIGLGLGEGEILKEIQSIFQFVLEDVHTFRTWMKHTDIIKACKELFEDAVDWQFREEIINEKRNGEGCGKAKGWTPIVLLRYLLETDILESCAIIGKFTQGNKVEEKYLTHRVVKDKGELDFLIQDCIKEGTYAGSNKYLLGHILTYYEDHQPQYTHLRASMLAYAHINLLEMLRRFGPNEVQVKQKISYPKDSVNTKLVKVFQKTKMPLAVGEYFSCSKHKLFVCHDCFWDWYAHKGFERVITDKKPSSNTSIAITKISEPLKEKVLSELIKEIQPGQWHDKGEKIHGPDPNIVYWPKNRHWESIKNITENGGFGKTMRAIQIFKDINMVVFTHTNVLAKDFQNDQEKKFSRVVIWDENDAQPLPFFGKMPHNWLKERADYYEKVLTDYRAKYPRLQELKKKMRCQNNRMQSDLFSHILFQRIASQKCLKIYQVKYPEIPIPLIYRQKDRYKQNCLVQIPSSSEKKELVKNDIVYLPLNTLSDKFLKDVLVDKKVIDWELEYAMTIHTSQGMTLKSPQHVW